MKKLLNCFTDRSHILEEPSENPDLGEVANIDEDFDEVTDDNFHEYNFPVDEL